MSKIVRMFAAAGIAAALASPFPASAGLYSDDLARCLVAKTSDTDKVALSQWMFLVITAHPETAAVASIDPARKQEITVRAAGIFETLLAETCRKEAALAAKYEGSDGVGNGFKVLGEIAMNTLMTDTKVQAETQNYLQHMDLERIGRAWEAETGK